MVSTDGSFPEKEREALLHATIKKVSEDYEAMKFNTAIAAMMTYVNEIYKYGAITPAELKTLLLLLNPVSPHITEEMWQLQGFKGRVYQATWPVWDESKLVSDEIEIVVQICGKVRAKIMIPADADKNTMEKLALEAPAINAAVTGKTIKKIVTVPGKLVNIVAV